MTTSDYGGETMMNKTFPAKTEALSDVLGFVEAALEDCGCPMKSSMAICLVTEELFVNVAHYAYPDGDGDMTLFISFDEKERVVTLRMTDKGIPFNPLKQEEPDVTLPAEEREPGGLGIFISKKTMDSLDYTYENGENILTMNKKI